MWTYLGAKQLEVFGSMVNSLLRGVRMHRLIRQLHLWIGAWGAIAAILFGISGFMQNHRAVMKLSQGDSTQVSRVDLAVPESARVSRETMRAWLGDSPPGYARPQPGSMKSRCVEGPSDWLGQVSVRGRRQVRDSRRPLASTRSGVVKPSVYLP